MHTTARHTDLRVRTQHLVSAFVGARGVLATVVAWVLAALVVVAVVLGGLPFLVVAVVLLGWGLVALFGVGAPSHGSRALMLGGVLASVLSVVYLGAWMSEGIDAADQFRAVAWWAQWGGQAAALFLLGVVAFVVGAVWSVLRQRRLPSAAGRA